MNGTGGINPSPSSGAGGSTVNMDRTVCSAFGSLDDGFFSSIECKHSCFVTLDSSISGIVLDPCRFRFELALCFLLRLLFFFYLCFFLLCFLDLDFLCL